MLTGLSLSLSLLPLLSFSGLLVSRSAVATPTRPPWLRSKPDTVHESKNPSEIHQACIRRELGVRYNDGTVKTLFPIKSHDAEREFFWLSTSVSPCLAQAARNLTAQLGGQDLTHDLPVPATHLLGHHHRHLGVAMWFEDDRSYGLTLENYGNPWGWQDLTQLAHMYQDKVPKHFELSENGNHAALWPQRKEATWGYWMTCRVVVGKGLYEVLAFGYAHPEQKDKGCIAVEALVAECVAPNGKRITEEESEKQEEQD